MLEFICCWPHWVRLARASAGQGIVQGRREYVISPLNEACSVLALIAAGFNESLAFMFAAETRSTRVSG